MQRVSETVANALYNAGYSKSDNHPYVLEAFQWLWDNKKKRIYLDYISCIGKVWVKYYNFETEISATETSLEDAIEGCLERMVEHNQI